MDPTIDPAAYVYARAYLATPERWPERRRWIAAATEGGGVARPTRAWAWVRDSDDSAAAVADLEAGAEALGAEAHGAGRALGSNPYAEDGRAGMAWAAGWLEAREAERAQGRADGLPGSGASPRPSGRASIPPEAAWIRPPRPEGPRAPLALELPEIP